MDATPGKATVADYMAGEGRFRVVKRLDEARYQDLCARAEREVLHRTELYAQLSHLKLSAERPAASLSPALAAALANGNG